MAARIRKGDRVIVLAGKDKGRAGEVIGILPDRNKALVRGVNMMTHHQTQSASQEGGIVRREAPIHLSNLAVEDRESGKPTRIGFKILEDGRKVRVAKRTGETIDG